MLKTLFSSALVLLLVGRAAPVALHSKPFQYSERYGFYGTAVVEGYLDLRTEMSYGPYEKEFAYFVITGAHNENISDFVSTGEFRLGCYDSDTIYSYNTANDGGYSNEISGDDLDELLVSDQTHRVQLRLTKPVDTRAGMCADTCYVQFRNFDVTLPLKET